MGELQGEVLPCVWNWTQLIWPTATSLTFWLFWFTHTESEMCMCECGNYFFWPKIWQCGKWNVYVWTHLDCTCKCYHQMRVYKECTHFCLQCLSSCSSHYILGKLYFYLQVTLKAQISCSCTTALNNWIYNTKVG